MPLVSSLGRASKCVTFQLRNLPIAEPLTAIPSILALAEHSNRGTFQYGTLLRTTLILGPPISATPIRRFPNWKVTQLVAPHLHRLTVGVAA